jgi:hypothetical protein
MSLVRVHCTPINLEVPLPIATETVQVTPFTILRSASLAWTCWPWSSQATRCT